MDQTEYNPYTGPGTVTSSSTAPPSSSPPGQVQTGAGTSPDYANLLKNDPAYLAAEEAFKKMQIQAGASRRSALRNALIRYGGVMPGSFKDAYGDIDKGTLDAASKNPNSILNQLKNNYAQSTEQFKRQLAARGALQSGDLNYGSNQLNQGYGQQQYDAANNLIDQFTGYENNYNDQINQGNENLVNALTAAEQNVYSNPAYRPTPASYAQLDPGMTSKAGQPVYTDGSGSYYDGNGDPFQLYSW